MESNSTTSNRVARGVPGRKILLFYERLYRYEGRKVERYSGTTTAVLFYVFVSAAAGTEIFIDLALGPKKRQCRGLVGSPIDGVLYGVLYTLARVAAKKHNPRRA